MRRYTWRTGVLEAVMLLVGALYFFPVYILVNLSVRESSDLSEPFLPTTTFTLDNYATAWRVGGLGGALGNTAVVTVVSTAIIILICATAAYPLARSTRRWSRIAFAVFLIGLLLPFQLGMIPLYMTMRDLGLLGSVWSLVLFYSGLQVPFTVFLFTSFLRTLPHEYEEAAAIDGASVFQTFWLVMFPLLRPVTGTAVILNVIFIWNDFLTPLLYLSGSGQETVPVALYGFVGQYVTDWNLVFAGLMISILPVLIVYLLMQRTIIRGFASGVKG